MPMAESGCACCIHGQFTSATTLRSKCSHCGHHKIRHNNVSAPSTRHSLDLRSFSTGRVASSRDSLHEERAQLVEMRAFLSEMEQLSTRLRDTEGELAQRNEEISVLRSRVEGLQKSLAAKEAAEEPHRDHSDEGINGEEPLQTLRQQICETVQHLESLDDCTATTEEEGITQRDGDRIKRVMMELETRLGVPQSRLWITLNRSPVQEALHALRFVREHITSAVK